MIGLARRWADSSWADPSRIAASLGVFAGSPACAEQTGDCTLFHLPLPRHRPGSASRKGWQAARTPGGLPVLLCGHIDNTDELATRLGLAGPVLHRSPERLYAAAFQQWGDDADLHIVGHYAALVALADGRVRMARSPLGGNPLFYAADHTGMVACSVYRPIFAAGWPQRLRPDSLLGTIGLRFDDDGEATPFEGVRQVPDGAIVHLSSAGATTRRWYDITALPEVRLPRDEDYVEQARELIARSVASALRQADSPAMSLSGGLDSPIVAAEVLRQLPQEQRLPAFTFHPLDEWQENVPPTSFADERGHVRAFAAMHPRLDVHYIDNREVDFDSKAHELFLAGSTA